MPSYGTWALSFVAAEAHEAELGLDEPRVDVRHPHVRAEQLLAQALRDRARTAALVPQYALPRSYGWRPAIEPIMMTWPDSSVDHRRRRRGESRAGRPSTLVSIISLPRDAVGFGDGLRRRARDPALLTRTSIGPLAADRGGEERLRRNRLVGDVEGAAVSQRRSPSSRSDAARPDRDRSGLYGPACCVATARPIPELAPVTTMCFFMGRSVGISVIPRNHWKPSRSSTNRADREEHDDPDRGMAPVDGESAA